ncbi:hypothetical protein [Actinoplanes sp. L3-i22]|uniref:hypothetical protein n=1 Tax=Actinoplanes sp. L3-i22 TaxID=2836373 RepID=UPI001C7406F3|nr:hypothetical protein [Actinoplanes sp. L3-i22]BCY07502.1 hypothetical protein L3i22_025900 [Actinoplanes sp. L3-i22]
MPDQLVKIEDATSIGAVMAIGLEPNPNENAITVTVQGLPAVSSSPIVFLQVAQSDGERIFPDQFTTQLISVDRETLIFRIKRVDAPTGWKQRLQINILLSGLTWGFGG